MQSYCMPSFVHELIVIECQEFKLSYNTHFPPCCHVIFPVTSAEGVTLTYQCYRQLRTLSHGELLTFQAKMCPNQISYHNYVPASEVCETLWAFFCETGQHVYIETLIHLTLPACSTILRLHCCNLKQRRRGMFPICHWKMSSARGVSFNFCCCF